MGAAVVVDVTGVAVLVAFVRMRVTVLRAGGAPLFSMAGGIAHAGLVYAQEAHDAAWCDLV